MKKEKGCSYLADLDENCSTLSVVVQFDRIKELKVLKEGIRGICEINIFSSLLLHKTQKTGKLFITESTGKP